jgi:hypothetical protein
MREYTFLLLNFQSVITLPSLIRLDFNCVESDVCES